MQKHYTHCFHTLEQRCEATRHLRSVRALYPEQPPVAPLLSARIDVTMLLTTLTATLLLHTAAALKAPQLDTVATSLREQIRVRTTDLTASNMPPTWTLDELRAPVSGLSGALFALPAACTPDPAEQALWVFQAVVSVLADYVYIGGPSPAHGIDRVLASFNFLRLAFLLSQQAPELFALGLVPAALFVYAQRMKD